MLRILKRESFPPVPGMDEIPVLLPEVVVHHPEESLHHGWIPRPVGVRESVEIGGGDAPYARKFPRVYLRDVHEFVEAEHVKELPEHKKIHLRAVRQLAGLYLLSLCQLGNSVSQNIAVDYLSKA